MGQRMETGGRGGGDADRGANSDACPEVLPKAAEAHGERGESGGRGGSEQGRQ